MTYSNMQQVFGNAGGGGGGGVPSFDNEYLSYIADGGVIAGDYTHNTTVGNMTGGGGLAGAFNKTVTTQGAAAYTSGTSGTVGLDWGSGNTRTCSQAVLFASTNGGLSANANGTLYLQYSDNGSDWSNAGSLAYTDGTTSGVHYTITSSETGAHRYWRIEMVPAASATLYAQEVCFDTNGTLTTIWIKDAVGTGYHFKTQQTATYPTYSATGGPNSRPAVLLPYGSGMRYGSGLLTLSEFTVYCICKTDNLDTLPFVFGKSTGGFGTFLLSGSAVNDDRASFRSDTYSYNYYTVESGVWRSVAIQYSATAGTVKLWIAGDNTTTSSTGRSGSYSSADLVIGRSVGGGDGYSLDGGIALLTFCNAVHSDATVQAKLEAMDSWANLSEW